MVMGCQGDIHLFLWARAAAARSVAGHGWPRLGEERGGRESRPGNTRQVPLPTGLARGYRRQSGGPVSQVLKERDGGCNLITFTAIPFKGVCASVIFSIGKHLLGLIKGPLSQVQDGVRSPYGFNSDPAISCFLRSTRQSVQNMGGAVREN